MKYSFRFICQAGELETKALLLASSLREGLECDHELIAGVPHPAAIWGQASSEVIAQLEAWGVHVIPIENPFGASYPIGSKLACVSLPTRAEKRVFLDSDVIRLSPFQHHDRFAISFNAKPADLLTFGAHPKLWRRIYRIFGMKCPTYRVVTTVSGQLSLPYFNAGFIAVSSSLPFGETWVECARRIQQDRVFRRKRYRYGRYHLDQIALPVAVARLGLAVDCLPERYNYPANLRTLDPSAPPVFMHYHGPHVLRREPLAMKLVARLLREHPILEWAFSRDPEWRKLLQARRHYVTPSAPCRAVRLPDSKPEIVITGLPRTGTSLLCTLFNGMENSVAINEPREIFQILQERSEDLRLFYRDLRRRILDGEAIENKLSDGRFIEDTAVMDQRAMYRPEFRDAGFLLATKNTLAYLARLDRILAAMPEALVVACVRNPIDTIASWKRSFPHLRDVDLDGIPLGGRGDFGLAEEHRARLETIAAIPDKEIRRALFWRHLVQVLLDHRPAIHIVRYEDMVADPVGQMTAISSKVGHPVAWRVAPETRRLAPGSRPVSTVEAQKIWAVCGPLAEAFGYEIHPVDLASS